VTSLATNLTEAARRYPERVALRLDEHEIPYAALDAASARLAGLLVARGLRPGDRVGVMLPNVPYFAIAYYGVLRAGGVVMPIHESDPEARAVIAWHEFAAAAGADCIVVAPGEFEELLGAAELLAEPVTRADSDTAVILTHADLRSNTEVVAQMAGLHAALAAGACLTLSGLVDA
jgi:long-chain acyl-CoA synthetase